MQKIASQKYFQVILYVQDVGRKEQTVYLHTSAISGGLYQEDGGEPPW